MSMPKWIEESSDPFIARIRDLSGEDYNLFTEQLYAERGEIGLCPYCGDAIQESMYGLLICTRCERIGYHRYGSSLSDTTSMKVTSAGRGRGLYARCVEAYAEHSLKHGVPSPSRDEILASIQSSSYAPDDAELDMRLRNEAEIATEILTDDSERPFDMGPDRPRVDLSIDVIGELLSHMGLPRTTAYSTTVRKVRFGSSAILLEDASEFSREGRGRIAGCQVRWQEKKGNYLLKVSWLYGRRGTYGKGARFSEVDDIAPTVSLETVLATIEARWDWESYTNSDNNKVSYQLTNGQKRYIASLMTKTRKVEGVSFVDGRPVLSILRVVNRISERAMAATTQMYVDEAIESWESYQAMLDDVAHPESEGAERGAAMLDASTRFFHWVGRDRTTGLDRFRESDPHGMAGDDEHKPKASSDKPWLGRQTYLSVMYGLLKSGKAANPRDAHNMAYAADTARIPGRILGANGEGFVIRVNSRTNQEKVLTYEAARMAWPFYGNETRLKMKELVERQREQHV